MQYDDLTIILPTLNEAGNVEALICEIQSQLPGSTVLVVDDQSTDQTPQIVNEVARVNQKVRLIERVGKPCLSQSIMTGVRSSATDYIAWMDADFSHPPFVLKELYVHASKSGCAIATRFARDNAGHSASEKKNDTFLNAALSTALNYFVHRVLKLQISDYTSGFIVCQRKLLADHKFIGDYGEYFIELMYYLDRTGVVIQEIPYESPPRRAGYSKTGTTIFKLMRRGVRYIIVVVRMTLPRRLLGKLSYARARTQGSSIQSK